MSDTIRVPDLDTPNCHDPECERCMIGHGICERDAIAGRTAIDDDNLFAAEDLDDLMDDLMDDLVEQVEVQRLATYAGPKDEPILDRASRGAAGVELYATVDVVIGPGERATVPVGLAVALPPRLEMQVRAKSGRARNEGLGLTNAVGTIDPDYRGEVGVLVHNLNAAITIQDLVEVKQSYEEMEEEARRQHVLFVPPMSQVLEALIARGQSRTITITRGQRVAQAVFAYFVDPEVTEVAVLGETERGANGYGSTGLGG
jgi:dUTP pyrophosphatase